MTNTSPVLIAVIVITAAATIGTLIYMVRSFRTFRGYRGIAAEVKRIAEKLDGELFRDGEDLVITGTYNLIPTVLRFSNNDSMPALTVEARIPAGMDLSLHPKHAIANKYGSNIRTSSWLEQRYVCRSKSPVEAELLLGQKGAMNSLVRLCCSQKTMIEVGPAKLQLCEMVLPSSLSRHLLAHLADISVLAELMQRLPGSNAVKVKSIPRERSSWAFRASVAAGVLIAAVSVMAAMRDRTQPVMAAGKGEDNGIVLSDAAVIPFANQWHVAAPADFDPAFTDYFSPAGEKLNGHISFDSDGDGHPNGTAYLLTNQSGTKRLVILLNHRPVFDSSFAQLAGVARVLSPYYSTERWDETKTVRQKISGEAILMVRNADDASTGVVFYFRNGTLQSSAVPDFRKISLQ